MPTPGPSIAPIIKVSFGTRTASSYTVVGETGDYEWLSVPLWYEAARLNRRARRKSLPPTGLTALTHMAVIMARRRAPYLHCLVGADVKEGFPGLVPQWSRMPRGKVPLFHHEGEVSDP